jgi:hypothetical protein
MSGTWAKLRFGMLPSYMQFQATKFIFTLKIYNVRQRREGGDEEGEQRKRRAGDILQINHIYRF